MIFKERFNHSRDFDQMFKRAEALIRPTNLSPQQKQKILEIFIEEVNITENWGHLIEEKDLQEELNSLLLLFDVANKNQLLSKTLNILVSHEYDSFVRILINSIYEALADKIEKYFNVMPEKNSKGSSKTWYSVHLTSLISHLLNEFKNA
ncbi:MAG: hypothetical protein IT416_01310 [Candidatus Pacebacteria bacterium]|nr:hypothetical protein [Candidatus Paceibacterota bacterium]